MIAEPPNQDKEALRTDQELSSSDLPLQKPSYLTRFAPFFIPLAIYQIIAGCILAFSFSSFFHASLMLLGTLSLALLGLSLYWTQTRINDTENTDRVILVSVIAGSFLKFLTTPLILSNISFQKEYMFDYLTAMSTAADKTSIPVMYPSRFSGTYDFMLTLYTWADLAILLYSVPMAFIVFKFIKSSGKVYSSFNFLFNTTMLGLSITLIGKLFNTMDSDEELFTPWSPKPLLILAFLSALLSLPVWLVNTKKWRIGFFTLSLTLMALSIFLAICSTSAASTANRIHATYSDIANLKQWKYIALPVPQATIEAYGCPNKYVQSDNCDKSLTLNPLEIPDFDQTSANCLNKGCAGLVGRLYAEQFFQIADWGLAVAVNTALLAFGLLYYCLARKTKTSQKKISRHYRWLVLLGVVGISCYIVHLLSSETPVKDYKPMSSTFIDDIEEASLEAYSVKSNSPGYLDISGAPIGGQPIITPPYGYFHVQEATPFSLDTFEGELTSKWLSLAEMPSLFEGGPTFDYVDTSRMIRPTLIFTEIFEAFGHTGTNNSINVAANVQEMMSAMIVNQTYNYIIMGLSLDFSEINILEQGKSGNSSETIEKLNTTNPRIAILSLPDENTNKFVIVIYAPDSNSTKEKEIYNNTIIPQALTLENTHNVPILITNSSKDLQLTNLRKHAFEWPRNKAPEFKTTQIPTLRREGLLNSSQQNISSVVFRLKGHYIDSDVEKSLNQVVVGREYDYILLDWGTSNLLKVVKKAPKNSTYEEFLQELVPGKSQIALLDFQSEDKDVPVFVSWNPEFIYTQPWQVQVYELILNEVSSLNIPYIETHDIGALALSNLTDFLISFWPMQVQSYSKYNSKQLLSIFQNQGDQKNPESLLSPWYEEKGNAGESVITEMLLRRSYKYILFKETEQNGETKLIFNKAAPKETPLSKFLEDVKGSENQLALLYLDFLNQDKIVCLAITDQKSLEKNYVNYARIAAAAEVYDIPTAYVTSPEKIDLEQLTMFTFGPEILHMLDDLKIDPDILKYWNEYLQGNRYGYTTILMQDNYSKVKVQKVIEDDGNFTYSNFTSAEINNNKQPLFAIVNLKSQNTTGTGKPLFVTWIPEEADVSAKILYKQVESLLFPMLPGSNPKQKILEKGNKAIIKG